MDNKYGDLLRYGNFYEGEYGRKRPSPLASGAVCFADGAGVGGVNITRWAWKPFVL